MTKYEITYEAIIASNLQHYLITSRKIDGIEISKKTRNNELDELAYRTGDLAERIRASKLTIILEKP